MACRTPATSCNSYAPSSRASASVSPAIRKRIKRHINLPSKLKVDRGGQVVFTKLFYDNDDFWRFRDRCVALGITAPIVPGLLPILSFAQIKRITSLCKARLPADLHDQLEQRRDDPAGQIQVGIDHARRQTENLLRGGAPGIHFYVLNRSDAIHGILDGLVVADRG